MAEQWEFYTQPMNDVLASIFVDVGARNGCPNPSRPNLLTIVVRPVHIQKEDADAGMGTAYLQIEEALITALAGPLRARLIGRIHTVGRREFYFYAATTSGFAEVVAEVMAGFPAYEAEIDEKDDPAWLRYLELLYPSPKDLRRVRDHMRLADLRKHGDSLDTVRPIEHYASFATRSGRDAYIAVVVAQGFLVSPDGLTEAADGERPFGAVVQRVDLPSEEGIDLLHIILASEAERHGGEYSGWEADLIRPAFRPGLMDGLLEMLLGR